MKLFVNVCRVKNFYRRGDGGGLELDGFRVNAGPQEGVKTMSTSRGKKKEEGEGQAAPAMPKPKWNRDGSPDFSQLQAEDGPSAAQEDEREAPPMPRARWNRDGTPDFRQFDEE